MSPVHVLQMSPSPCFTNESSPCFTNESSPCFTNESSPCFTNESSPCFTNESSPCFTNESSPCFTSPVQSRFYNMPKGLDNFELWRHFPVILLETKYSTVSFLRGTKQKMKNNFIVQENVLFLYFLRISSLRKTGKQNLDVAFPDYRLLFKFKKMFWGTCPHPNGHDSYFVPSVRGPILPIILILKERYPLKIGLGRFLFFKISNVPPPPCIWQNVFKTSLYLSKVIVLKREMVFIISITELYIILISVRLWHSHRQSRRNS